MKNRSTTRSHGAKGTSFRRLTRSDLVTFDREAKDLVLAAMELGCVGRVSSKGHCILRNNAGGTASVPRNMTSPNRTSQNARADMKRFLAEHRPEGTDEVSTARVEDRTEQMTVSQAFVDHGPAFSRWFDAQPNGLPADAVLSVTTRGDDVEFVVAELPERDRVEDREASAPRPEPFICTKCGRSFAAATALGSHRRTHRSRPDLSISALARANGIGRDAVRTRLSEAGDHEEDADITPQTVKEAGLAMPTDAPAPAPAERTEHPAADVDDAEVLRRVREALGEDPRIAELTARNARLAEELASQRERADNLQARLDIIQEAIHV